MLTSGEKYDPEFIFAVSGAKKRTNRVRIVLVDESNSYTKAARSITPACTTLAVVAENGELKELGTHDQLIRQKGKYFELYRLQSEALKFIEE